MSRDYRVKELVGGSVPARLCLNIQIIVDNNGELEVTIAEWLAPSTESPTERGLMIIFRGI